MRTINLIVYIGFIRSVVHPHTRLSFPSPLFLHLGGFPRVSGHSVSSADELINGSSVVFSPRAGPVLLFSSARNSTCPAPIAVNDRRSYHVVKLSYKSIGRIRRARCYARDGDDVVG